MVSELIVVVCCVVVCCVGVSFWGKYVEVVKLLCWSSEEGMGMYELGMVNCECGQAVDSSLWLFFDAVCEEEKEERWREQTDKI